MNAKSPALMYVFFMCLLLCSSLCVASENRQVVAGAGPSTALVKLFFRALVQQQDLENYKFLIPDRSIKHAGGIRASNEYIFGRTGRQLSDAEKNQGKAEIILAAMPLVFVTGKGVGINELSYQQLESIFKSKITNWREVGGEDADIVLVGREKTEASLSVLRLHYPFLDGSDYDMVFARDHRVVNFVNSKTGRYAISFGAKANFDGLNVINVEGYSPAINLGLVYDIKNKEHPLVKKSIAFSNGIEWMNIIKRNGYFIKNE
ncbi:MAG: substrate-binding domain-containing protein [Gammaproteobacteria bacterium]|nr:substrate-binding domain-containing protein [Gammaproteobacteria bacterium]